MTPRPGSYRSLLISTYRGGPIPERDMGPPRHAPVRIIEYPALGLAIAQDVPADVTGAYQRLIAAGYDSRLMKSGPP